MCRWELGFNILICDHVVYPLKSIWKRTLYEIPLIYVIYSVSTFKNLYLNGNLVKLLCSSMPSFLRFTLLYLKSKMITKHGLEKAGSSQICLYF